MSEQLHRVLAELDQRLDAGPFHDADDHVARRTVHELGSVIRAVRARLRDLGDDAIRSELAGRADRMDRQLALAWDSWQRARAIDAILTSATATQAEIAGWRDEPAVATWSTWSAIGELGLPRTAAAIRTCTAWLGSLLVRDTFARYPDDRAVRTAVAEIERARDAAAEKLNGALHAVIDEAQQLPAPTRRGDLDRPERLIRQVAIWFAGTRYLAGNVARARALFDRWTTAVDELDRLGREAYRRLAAEAYAAWPAIASAVRTWDDFDPHDLATYRDRAVRLTGVYNRARWDFDGRYDFAIRHRGMPIAGDFDPAIAEALARTVELTRQPIDDHVEWDVIGIVLGSATINQRAERGVRVEARVECSCADHAREIWHAVPCVRLRIIALHAGAVAVGPK